MTIRLLSRTVLAALVGLVATWALIGPRHAWAFPEPALVSDAWLLDFECDTPRTMAITDENGATRWYWYLTYHVENNTGDDQLFIPEVTVLTDRGHIITTDVDVPSKVFQKIKQELQHPLLERSSKIIGKILQGPDHAKDGVAIWAVPEEDVDAFTLFFSGVSGESQNIEHPTTGQTVMLRKTLMIDYATPGTPPSPQQPVVIETQRDWIMR